MTALAPVPPAARVAASLDRWNRIAEAYRARGMRTYARRAERTATQLRRALARAEKPATLVQAIPVCPMCGDGIRPGEGWDEYGVGLVHDLAGRDCRLAALTLGGAA